MVKGGNTRAVPIGLVMYRALVVLQDVILLEGVFPLVYNTLRTVRIDAYVIVNRSRFVVHRRSCKGRKSLCRKHTFIYTMSRIEGRYKNALRVDSFSSTPCYSS